VHSTYIKNARCNNKNWDIILNQTETAIIRNQNKSGSATSGTDYSTSTEQTHRVIRLFLLLRSFKITDFIGNGNFYYADTDPIPLTDYKKNNNK
jgi:hypothetical protein